MTMVSAPLAISLGGSATTGGLNQSVNIQLGQAASATISMNDTNARALAVVTTPNSQISMSNFYGKPAGIIINLVISANSLVSYNILTAATAANGGVAPPAGTTVNLTVNAGVTQGMYWPYSGNSYVNSPGVRTGTGWTSGCTVKFFGTAGTAITASHILGYGGNPSFEGPGRGASGQVSGGVKYGEPGQNGGDAIWLEDAALTLDFTGFLGVIGGGGGGGGGGNGPNGGNGAGSGGGGGGYAAGGATYPGQAQTLYRAGGYGITGGSIGFATHGNGGTGGGQGTGSTATSYGPSGGGGAGGLRGVNGSPGAQASTVTNAGQGGGGGGLGGNGAAGGDVFSSIGGNYGGQAGAWLRKVGGVGTVIGTPGTTYGAIKTT